MGSLVTKASSKSIEDYRPYCARIGDDVIIKWKVSIYIHVSPDCKYFVVVFPFNKKPLVTVINTENFNFFQIILQDHPYSFSKRSYSRVDFDQDGERIYVIIGFSEEIYTINLETQSLISDNSNSRQIIPFSMDNYQSYRYDVKVLRINFQGENNYDDGIISNTAHVFDEKNNLIKEIQHDDSIQHSKIVKDRYVFTKSSHEARLTKIN